MNLCNASFHKRKLDLLYPYQRRVLRQIIIMSNFLVHSSIYLTNEIDFDRTVNFDPSGTAIFNLVQCEYVEEPDSETLKKHCIFLLRSINTIFFCKMTSVVQSLAEKIRHNLLNGSYLFDCLSLDPNADQSEFMFGLNVENNFYIYDNTFQPLSMCNVADNQHLVGPINSKFMINVRIFGKNSKPLFDFIICNNILFDQIFDDMKFSYVLYNRRCVAGRYYLTY
ncbi:hypothetical protein MHBO_002680 [Bonamia ostreae]|uniref:Uncharacterized protein n=1 Tax=Bonamia ostreae TaxID=126728 RepID=A0ABV2AN50_9EUKA